MNMRPCVAGLCVSLTVAVSACANGGRHVSVGRTKTGADTLHQSTVPAAVTGQEPDALADHFDSATARQICDDKGREAGGDTADLRAALESTAASVRRWQQTRPGSVGEASDYVKSKSPESTMYVCYFDNGQWAIPRPAQRQNDPPVNRIVVEATVDDSAPDMYGYQQPVGLYGRIPIARP